MMVSVFLMCTAVLATDVKATPSAAPASDAVSATDTERANDDGARLEISFGNSQLFLDQPLFSGSAAAQQRATLPITSVVMIAEGLVTKRLSVALFFSLPLDTKKTLEAGNIVEEPVASSLALGVGYVPAEFKLFRHSVVQLQVAAFAGRTFTSHLGDRFFPMIAGRIRFVSRQGFALYLGQAFAFHEDALALIYGIGNRF
ncbi:MAG: hypothetical protein AAB426_12565 [Myxococcota bacterium]